MYVEEEIENLKDEIRILKRVLYLTIIKDNHNKDSCIRLMYENGLIDNQEYDDYLKTTW